MLSTLVVILLWSCMYMPAADCHRNISCEEARVKCLFRSGCAKALQSYIVDCSTVLHRTPGRCPEECQQALIALTSTDEGKDFMECSCSDDLCHDTKQRLEVCRPTVIQATMNDTIVSCRVAEWICSADNVCSTAMEYYNMYCQPMFHGRKCSSRCKNSISILKRQEKAAKLITCVCDGHEEFDCRKIRTNMEVLCHHKTPTTPQPPRPNGSTSTTTTIATSSQPPDLEEPICAGTPTISPSSWSALLLLAWLLLTQQHIDLTYGYSIS